MRLTPIAALLRGCGWCQHARGSDEADAQASLNRSHATEAKNPRKKLHVTVWCLDVLFPSVRKQIAQADMVSDVLQTLSVSAVKQLLLKRRLENSVSTAGLHMFEETRLLQ